MAGNTLDTATKIDVMNRTRTFRGSVSPSDPIDYYRFDVNRASRLSTLGVTLRNLSNNADLALLNAQGRVVNGLRSSNGGDSSETLSSQIRPGTYFLRVNRVSQSTRYKLTVAVTNIASLRTATPFPNVTFSPQVLDDARKINILGRTRKFEDSVGRGDQDFYQFELARASTFSAVLRNLSKNADLDVINGQGRLIGRSSNGGDASDVLSNILDAGTYYVRVYSRGSSTSYDLLLSAVTNTNISPPTSGGGETPTLIRDISSGSAASNPAELVTLGSTLYFAATTSTGGRELWRSDGTSSGTEQVIDLNRGGASSNPTDLIVVGNFIYFAADDGNDGVELWRSDGTEAGTEQVADINPGAASSTPSELVNFNGVLYFAADDGTRGRELWQSDGTSNGTQLVSDINRGSSSSNPSSPAVVGTTLFFAADDGRFGNELWSYDGTSVNLVSDINTGAADSNPTDLVSFNNALYFSAEDRTNGKELWRSNDSGTDLFFNIRSGSASSNPTDLVVSGSRLFFAADDGQRGSELWITDGTSSGTLLLQDIRTGAAGSDPESLVDVAGVLYFTADNGDDGRQIFLSNGTSSGTTLQTSATGLNPSELIGFTSNGISSLVFAASTTTTGPELYRILT